MQEPKFPSNEALRHAARSEFPNLHRQVHSVCQPDKTDEHRQNHVWHAGDGKPATGLGGCRGALQVGEPAPSLALVRA